jgi:hypothetical protein
MRYTPTREQVEYLCKLGVPEFSSAKSPANKPKDQRLEVSAASKCNAIPLGMPSPSMGRRTVAPMMLPAPPGTCGTRVIDVPGWMLAIFFPVALILFGLAINLLGK